MQQSPHRPRRKTAAELEISWCLSECCTPIHTSVDRITTVHILGKHAPPPPKKKKKKIDFLNMAQWLHTTYRFPTKPISIWKHKLNVLILG
jgi:hypothetical protein